MTNPKIIAACTLIERQGRAIPADIARATGFALSTANCWLSDAEKLGMLIVEPGSRPRRYTVAPNWRAHIEERPAPEKTKTELACEIVEKLGMASASEVGKKMGSDSNAAAGLLSIGLRKGWLKLEEQGLRNLYCVTSDWYAHVAGDKKRFQTPAEPEQQGQGDDLRIEYVGKPRMAGLLVGTHWHGLQQCRLGVRA